MEHITNNILFGITLSLIAFETALFIKNKTKFILFNPLLLSIIFVMAFLILFKIDYSLYEKGGSLINSFLGPATVILAVPLYKQLDNLKKHALPILVGISIGSLIGIISVVISSLLLGLNLDIIASLIPKSVTTPIGIEVSNQLGGIVPITVLSIIITGIIGAIIAPIVFKLFNIKDSIAQGIALGTSSHAIGTTRALELGEIEGAMSSLSIGIAGIITVFLSPIIFQVFNTILALIK